MPKRKLHKLINTIEHKHCGKCDQWKLLDQFAKYGNGKQSYCKRCDNKRRKQNNKVMKEKLKNERDKAPTGFLVCLRASCTVKGLQPLDQFISDYERDEEQTNCCKTCRGKVREVDKRRQAPCQKVWDDWRREHPCVICNQDPEHVHNPLLIEADHLPEFKKLKQCSDMYYWSHSQRGVPALQAELNKCQALCVFHHALQTQQRSNKTKEPCVLRRRAIINAEKHKRGCCSNPKCNRVVKEGEECAFHFDHRDPLTKFMYNGKPKNPTKFVRLPQALFDTQWPLEQAKCDLLCANCHKLKDNRDGYKT